MATIRPASDLTVGEVTAATRCPPEAVAAHWPLLLDALTEQGVGVASRNSQLAMAATVAVETAFTFRPMRERQADPTRQPAVWAQQAKYWDSGFYGRGFIQRTWEANYRASRQRLLDRFQVDIIAEPDQLLDPAVAAYDAALYWVDHGIPLACAVADWTRVRRLVNGGTNGLTEFVGIVRRFGVAT